MARGRTGLLLTGPALLAAALAGLVACSTDDPPVSSPAAPLTSPPAPGMSSGPAGSTVRATLAGTELRLEVADTREERARGLMGRTSVPPGTGMLFRYDAPVRARFYMFSVPIPLRATFLAGDRVVSTVVMPPCPLTDPAACPTYGADAPFDMVVETDPSALARVRPGDAFELLG